jgi:hypothetical protein
VNILDLPKQLLIQDGKGLGPCCHCMREGDAVNLITLNLRAPVPGTGWGCLQCGLAMDGGVAVLCDECFDADKPILFICSGYPALGIRAPISQFNEKFFHHLAKHPEVFKADPVEASAEETAHALAVIEAWKKRGDFAAMRQWN